MKRIIRGLVWDAWNVEHIKKHNISPSDIEWTISNVDPMPIFQHSRGGTIAVWGKDEADRFLLVILAEREFGSYYIVTARPMTDREKRRYLRRMT